MAGISIGIASETKAFKMGIETGVIKPVEDAEKALDDLGKNKGPDKLEDGFKGAQKATEKLGRETKQLGDDIEREARQAYRKLGDEAEKGTRKASEGFKDMKTEAESSMRGATASIKDVSDGLDLVQELAANSLAGFGPAGLIAGAAAATGIGLVTEGLRASQEASEKLKEELIGAFSAAVDEGRAYLSELEIMAAVQEVLMDPTQRKEAQKEARAIGVETVDYVRALKGDRDALNEAIEAGVAAEARMREQTEGMIAPNGELIENYNAGLQAAERINAKLAEQKKVTDEIVEGAEMMLQLTQKDEASVERRNQLLAATPKEVRTTLSVDDSALRNVLNSKYLANVALQVTDKYGRIIR